MDKWNTGDTVRINDDVLPEEFSGQECVVVERLAQLNDNLIAYMVFVPGLGNDLFFSDELALVEKAGDED